MTKAKRIRRVYSDEENFLEPNFFNQLRQQDIEDLIAGDKFEQLARNYSTCSSKKKGGNLGEFAKGDMVPEFWNACTKLKINEISQPVKSKFGYHVIKRTG